MSLIADPWEIIYSKQPMIIHYIHFSLHFTEPKPIGVTANKDGYTFNIRTQQLARCSIILINNVNPNIPINPVIDITEEDYNLIKQLHNYRTVVYKQKIKEFMINKYNIEQYL